MNYYDVEHGYQRHARQHILDNPYCGLFMEMGLGKTVATATALNELLYDSFEIRKPLIIAPLRVAQSVWTTEVEKWDHLKHLKISKILGSEKERKEALLAKADIFIINVENVAWLVAHLAGAWPFDLVVLDESSKFKNPQSIRFKALRSVRPKMKRVILLSGTPAPNGLLDLWAPMYLLDQGERLGKTISKYRDTYFKPGRGKGFVVYEYNLRKGYDWLIYEEIGDICISMKEADYLKLPERIENTITIQMPPALKKKYDDFEREQVLAVADGVEISPANAAGLSNKLTQFANGAIYGDLIPGKTAKEWHEIHDLKIDELREILEIADGKPVLVFYEFKHDLERILHKLRSFKPKVLKGDQDIKDWNDKKIPFLLAHPATAGHGLNMQAGGNCVVWFGLTWNLEYYQQGVKRVHRQGQLETVINNKLIIAGTMDEDIAIALVEKADTQEALMQAVKARINKYLKAA